MKASKKSKIEQKWPNNIVLIRHGQTPLNIAKNTRKNKSEKIWWLETDTRDMDMSLTELGMAQAEITGKNLCSNNPKFDIIYSSPYNRTKQTTSIILNELDYSVPVKMEERIREKEFGVVDRLTKKGIELLYPREAERKEHLGKYYYRPPGGENYPDVNLRVHSFLGTLIRDRPRQNVLVVCHGVIIYSFRKLLERFEEGDVLRIDEVEGEVKNCGVTTYAFDKSKKRLVLKEYNKTFY